MRVFFGGLLVLFSLIPAVTAEKENPVDDLSLAIAGVLPLGQVTVEIRNSLTNANQDLGRGEQLGCSTLACLAH
jgi:hypothetical protein